MLVLRITSRIHGMTYPALTMARLRRQDLRSDEALVAACNEGDSREAPQAFETLYRRHKDYVLRVASALRAGYRHRARRPPRHVHAYLLRRFPPTGEGIVLSAKLTTLLYPIAKNTAITALRKSGRFPAAEDVAPDDLPGPESGDTTDIRGVLADLPGGQREVLELRFVDDLSLQEIARRAFNTARNRQIAPAPRYREAQILGLCEKPRRRMNLLRPSCAKRPRRSETCPIKTPTATNSTRV